MIVIGVGSRAQQGKSLFCSVIVEQCSRIGLSCQEYSISDTIISYCISHNILPQDATRETCDPNILVRVGSEKRADNENFWIDQIKHRISSDTPTVALIPNVRFASEASAVRSLDGHLVRVSRLNANGTRFISADRDPNNAAECSLDLFSWDFEIVNMASRPYWLRRQAIGLLSYLLDGAE